MDHAEVVDADGDPVDLSLPQPDRSEETEGDGPVAEASVEAPEAEPAHRRPEEEPAS